MDDELVRRIGDEAFVSLTTFKKDGSAVSSPMWIARDDQLLAAWTPAQAWKVRRIRRDPRVELTPCNRSGGVPAGAPVLRARADVIADPSYVSQVEAAIKDKYGLMFRLVTLVETVRSRGRKSRVALRITPGA
ncbi:PPOX class F420-dependent oxidoreductase [Mycolicibacterium mengxianglii]|uniref:PPOX class F420-dependent oxidoreductase n=1 Tax=Mycolicibacterium mengxianglii TaxID=2736649 RepID=UPI0018D19AE3|nr:PPOX class F420-dependent oxidoreductase [Mycolicibacterium mengxianglii]